MANNIPEAVIKAARIEKESAIKVNAVLLSTYLEFVHKNDIDSIVKASGHPKSQIERWLSKEAILAGGRVYLKKSKFKETKEEETNRLTKLDEGATGVKLESAIKSDFKGRQEIFAKTRGSTQQQVSRWTSAGSIYLLDQVYRMQRPLGDPTLDEMEDEVK